MFKKTEMPRTYMVPVLIFATLTGLIPGNFSSVIKPQKIRTVRSSSGRGSLGFESRPDRITSLKMFETTYLECSVRSNPPAIIYWIKDGKKITHSNYEFEGMIDYYARVTSSNARNSSSRSITISKLAVPCAKPEDSGKYECIADNGYDKVEAETNLIVEQTNEVWSGLSSSSTESTGDCFINNKRKARINMWSKVNVALSGSTIRLICRASGFPKPKVIWYNEDENGKHHQIHNNHKYTVLKNGDLVIRDLSWEADMGQFICKAINEFGIDTISPFVYPLAK